MAGGALTELSASRVSIVVGVTYVSYKAGSFSGTVKAHTSIVNGEIGLFSIISHCQCSQVLLSPMGHQPSRCEECVGDAMMSFAALSCYHLPTAPLDRPPHVHHRIPLQPNSNSRTLSSLSSSTLSRLCDELTSAFLSSTPLVVDSLLPQTSQADRYHGVTEEGSPQGTLSASAPAPNDHSKSSSNISRLTYRLLSLVTAVLVKPV